MKNIRAILSLVFTLSLGILIGFFASQQLVRHSVKDVESLSSYESFRSRLYSIIVPSEEQIEDIEPLIEEFLKNMNEVKKRFRSEYGKVIQKFHNELKPYLNEEQIEKLDKFPKYFMSRHGKSRADSTRYHK